MDPIPQYRQTVEELKAAIGDAERIARVVAQGAGALQEWRKTMVSNSGGFPMDIALSSNSPSIDAREWPTGDQIAEALQRYHQAKSAAQQAYAAIPENQRDVVQAPESLV